MKHIISLIVMAILSCKANHNGSGNGNETQVGGRCEDCEIMLVDMPENSSWQGTIFPTGEPGERLVINGKIYKKDGFTPAPGIILYLYQTNAAGYYAPAPNQNPASRRHGRIRGWVKSNAAGEYKFTTIKPGVYPDRSVPAHIHPIIKEGKSLYYIDDYVFAGEFKVDADYRTRQELRCGSGIIEITKDSSGTWRGSRNLILGLNIPDYH